MLSRRLARSLDERVGGARFARSALDKVFPDHFSFMLGEIALYAFMALVLTGVYLSLFFEPSLTMVQYNGSYVPLKGVPMSSAFSSALRISFDVRAGLVMRQMHHWAANLFLAAILAHLLRIFFTGAFRKPRDINWPVGLTLFLLALVNGFAGYSLLDDLLSGTGLRVASSILLSIPLVGEWLSSFLFGGEFPADSIIHRLFIFHVLVIPLAIAALLSVHLALVWHQKHTQFPGPGRTEDNVVGSKLWPRYAAKSVSLLIAVFGVLAALGGLIQINPVWLYGPYDPAKTTTYSQPDWYMGWLEGALRLWPPWELRLGPRYIPAVFFPAVLLPTLTFLALYLWPYLEARMTGDHEAHNLLCRPRDCPVRTGFGVGALTFYVVLFLAGSQDLAAARFGLSVNALLIAFRVASVVLPPLVGLATYALCRAATRPAGTPPLSAVLHHRNRPGAGAAPTGPDGDPQPEPVAGPGQATAGPTGPVG